MDLLYIIITSFLLRMVPETVYTYGIVFFCSVFYVLWAKTVSLEAFFHRLITMAEFKTPSSARNKYHDEIKNRFANVLFFVYNIFSFEMRLSLKPLCHTKQICFYPPTQPPKTSD